MTDYYVATDGDDTNAGTIDLPFASIVHGIGQCAAGDTCYVRGGTYRHLTAGSSEVNGSAATASGRILVTNYQNEVPVIKGSQVVSGWVLDTGNVWKVEGWQENSQQVFVDFDANPNPGLQQIGIPSSYYTGSSTYPNPVGTGRADMTAGTFFYDPTALVLYVWLADGSSPNDHVMEVSIGGTSGRLLFFHHGYFDVNGLTFRHSNNSAHSQIGGAVNPGSYAKVTNCDIQYCDFMGAMLSSTATETTYQNCIISNNGGGGITASNHIGGVVQNCTINGNNTRMFGQDWAACGIKLSANSQATIQNNEVGNNNCTGIWSDTCYTTVDGHVIQNNYVHDNGIIEGGIMLEVTTKALCVNNVIVNCRRRGIFLSTSADCTVCNNTIIGTIERAALEFSGGARSGISTSGNRIENNLVINTDTASGCYDAYMQGDDGTSIINYNDYWRSDGTLQFEWNDGHPVTLGGWQSDTGWDLNGLNVDPKFTAIGAGALQYALSADSPCIGVGADLSAIFDKDYTGKWRVAGAFDMGAIAFAAGNAPATPVWTLDSNGSTTAVVGTEQVLSAPATNATYVLLVDCSQMALGDVLELRAYTKGDGVNLRPAFTGVFANLQVMPIKMSPPLAADAGAQFTLKQVSGSAKSFPWRLLRV